MNFKEKVQSMTAKEIIMAMVDGLKEAKFQIKMETYGCADNGICFGCAATAAISKISGITFNVDNIDNRDELLGVHDYFLYKFEAAVDWLRRGDIDYYNRNAKLGGFAIIEEVEGLALPTLTTDNWKEGIASYIELANQQ